MERRFGARIEWLPFNLHPEYPPEGIPRRELDERYGAGFAEQVRSMIEEAGFRYAPPSVVPNAFGSLQLGELARNRGRHAELHPRVFATYWSEGRDIGDLDTLVSLGSSVDLDPDEIRRVIEEGTYRDRIETSTRLAVELGVDGVPAWLIDGETLMTGAHPVEVFGRVLQQLGYGRRTGTARSAR